MMSMLVIIVRKALGGQIAIVKEVGAGYIIVGEGNVLTLDWNSGESDNGVVKWQKRTFDFFNGLETAYGTWCAGSSFRSIY